MTAPATELDLYKIHPTVTGKGSVRILDGFRIVIERKSAGDWAGIQTQAFIHGRKQQRVLATRRFYDPKFIRDTLRHEMGKFLASDRTKALSFDRMVLGPHDDPLSGDGEANFEAFLALLPITQWISLIKPDLIEEDLRPQALSTDKKRAAAPAATPQRGSTIYRASRLGAHHDDGRSFELEPCDSRRTVAIWHKLTLITERLNGFMRLSMNFYIRKGESRQKVLAISHRDTLSDAKRNLDTFLAEYKRAGNSIPDSLVARLPIAQWFSLLQDVATGDAPRPKPKVATMVRWRIAPNVTLSFSERVSKPALMVFYREVIEGQRNESIRVGTVGAATLAGTIEALTSAIMVTLANPVIFARCLSDNSLIPAAHLRPCLRMAEQPARALVAKLVGELPIASFLHFYDAATLPMRLTSHRKRLYPEMDASMRWISEAGPSTFTAEHECWLVLVGNSTRTAVGQAFPWGDSKSEALEQAKAWRDKQEAGGGD